MNKNTYRLIFSQSQQQFIVVSELAKSKTPSERRSAVGDCIRFSDGVNINLESVQDTMSNRSDNINGEIVGDLNIESRQDSNHYDSKQVQAGGSFSVTYGSGGGGSVNVSASKGKVNYAQVNEQSGLRVGEDGMNLTVGGNTHLKGGVIDSQATADKNHFSTGTLTTENIDNYSDVSVQSVSGGLSTDMGNLAMTGVAAAMSALGNVSKDDSSTTQSAVSSNINLEVRNGDVPTALSRDTDNANQKVTEFDKTEYQERAEMAQVIGQISNNSIVLSLKPKLDEAQQQKADAEGVLANDNSSTEQKAAAQIQLANAEQAIAKYGKGGAIQMAVRAVTGVLQGIATGSAESAVVGGVSPYANLAIKQATEGNDSANIMAHAVLGAVEAYATG
ncbi:ESPR domain-containing protein, partial [Testudinibacter sp. TR-2022]|uniref:ESPR domain-containing protein n=1 Tax=Testudinibacter sp. TR-2022 TaxID=2585029 RepID=UPI0011748DC4